MRLRFFFALTLVVLAGCSGSGTGGSTGSTGADAGSVVGRSCNVDAECGTLRCDPVRRQCICLSDADCAYPDGGQQYCSNFTGLCVDSVPGCTTDNDCPALGDGTVQFCNPETRACQSLRGFCEQCNTDQECGTNNHCLADSSLGASFCTKACSQQTDCPSGTVCTALDANDSQCLPAPGSDCKTFTGCVPDALSSCNSNADCADANDDQVCDSGSGLCRARVQACPLGTVCDPSVKVCVNSCSVDRDCSSDGSLACVNHICVPLSVCQSDTDCPTDKVCNVPPGQSGGTCVPFCHADTDCAVGEVCQPVIEADGSSRQACLSGCLDNSGCPGNSLCEDSNGNPFVPSGTALGQCLTTFNGGAACQTTDACTSCQVCTNNTCASATAQGYCHSCDPAAGGADCVTATGLASSVCLSLGGRDGQGNIIASGPYACGYPCGTSNPNSPACPKGFVCDAVTDAHNNQAYNCVPSDFDCGLANGSTAKCQ